MGFFKNIFGGKEEKVHVEKRNLFNIRVGDIVTYNLEDYNVIGLLEYDDEGWTWICYYLESGADKIWLSVEQDDEVEVGVFKNIRLPIDGKPQKELEYKGTRFYLEEKSDARIIRSEGQVGAKVGHWLNYWEYSDDEEEKYISLEEWDGDLEASLGQYIEPYELEILAGS